MATISFYFKNKSIEIPLGIAQSNPVMISMGCRRLRAILRVALLPLPSDVKSQNASLASRQFRLSRQFFHVLVSVMVCCLGLESCQDQNQDRETSFSDKSMSVNGSSTLSTLPPKKTISTVELQHESTAMSSDAVLAK